VLQIAADPAANRVVILSGHQIVGPVVSAPWADQLGGFDRTTGLRAWAVGTPTTAPPFPPQGQRLSLFALSRTTRQVLLIAGQRALAVDERTGALAATVLLPDTLDCVPFALGTQGRPTLDDNGRPTFPCEQSATSSGGGSTSVGVRVDFAAGTIAIVAAPAPVSDPTPPTGILGHTYTLTPNGLLVGGGPAGEDLEALPFDGAHLLAVERDEVGTPTGRLYLAGTGAQVAVLEDADPTTLAGQRTAFWAAALAERAVALTVAPQMFQTTGQRGEVLPTLPGFLLVPGRWATTPCFGSTQPLADNSITHSTGVTANADGMFTIDLQLDVRTASTTGTTTATRHWVVAVSDDGTARITQDTGGPDPFHPSPPVACPV
jgi:hypothetical protein